VKDETVRANARTLAEAFAALGGAQRAAEALVGVAEKQR
jgi:hypothetical protein